MATLADDIAAISTDSATLATDQGAVTTAQAALAAAQAKVAADNTTITTADTTLSAALKAAGVPAVVGPNADGSFTIYTYADPTTTPPGFTVTTAQPADKLPG